MNKQEQQNKDIKKQLRQFGLNPNEWTLKVKGANQKLSLHHKKDQDFSLLVAMSPKHSGFAIESLSLQNI